MPLAALVLVIMPATLGAAILARSLSLSAGVGVAGSRTGGVGVGGTEACALCTARRLVALPMRRLDGVRGPAGALAADATLVSELVLGWGPGPAAAYGLVVRAGGVSAPGESSGTSESMEERGESRRGELEVEEGGIKCAGGWVRGDDVCGVSQRWGGGDGWAMAR